MKATKSMPEGFIEAWDQLIREDPGRQVEVGGTHPLRLMYGSDQAQRPLFFLISSTKPGLVTLSDAVEVERGTRSVDGLWTLSLTLRDGRFISEFMALGNELVDSTSVGYNELHALQLLVDAIRHWKGLFSYSPPQQLTKPQIRGLLGEMWFGFTQLVQTSDFKAVVNAWRGPFKSPQDFNFPSGHAYEVKTTYSDTSSVRISSAEQLDADNRVLDLVVVTMADVDENTPDAFSLPTMFQDIDNALDPVEREQLRKCFRELSVDPTDTYYTDFWFRVDACTSYRVSPEFPAIRRTSLSPIIDEVNYEIALYGIAEFKCSTWTSASTANPKGE